MPRLVIVDYGMGNLRSVQKAFERLGTAAAISSDPEVVRRAGKVVLPGVGAFPDAIAKLRTSGLGEAVVERIDAGAPFLGICLGLQLLFERGTEGGVHSGLGVLKGSVVPFAPRPNFKIPHMGWNTGRIVKPECPLLRGLPADPSFYFVHGYYAEPADKDAVAVETDYGGPFCAAVWSDNVFATQFHPEKSQALGAAVLANFALL